MIQLFMKSLCQRQMYNIWQNPNCLSNRGEHFLSRWGLILLGDFFYCLMNTGRQVRQTIPNKPQRKSGVFIQLCLMTILLLPSLTFVTAHCTLDGIRDPAANTSTDL